MRTTGSAIALPLVPAAGLTMAAISAMLAAVAGRSLGPAGAAGVIVIAVMTTAIVGRAGPWLAALPAALAAVPAPALPVVWPRSGPVRIDACIQPGLQQDPRAAETKVAAVPWERRGPRFLVIVHGGIELLPGDRIAGIGRLAAQEHRRAAGLMPVVEIEADALRIEPGPGSIARWTEVVRTKLRNALLTAVRGEAGALLCHLVLGHGPALADDLTAAHRATGLAHLLAVSGAHASMLALLLAGAFAALTGRSPADSRSFRRLVAPVLLGYGAITGMQPPVFRALVALGLVLWARAAGRVVPVSSALALPALLTAVLVPQDLLSASFNLSYAAVIGLALANSRRGQSWTQRWLWLPVLASFWATLTTMPLTLFYFGQVAPWSIAATPLLAPVVAVMLATGLLVAALGTGAAEIAAVAAVPLEVVTTWYCAAVRALAEMPLAPVLAWSQPPPLVLLGMVCFSAALVAAKRTRWSAGLACGALAMPYFVPAGPPPPSLALLAVGHGQACVAHLDHGATVVVDCGNLGDPQQAATAVVKAIAPRRQIDLLVLTHDHSDHTSGVTALLQQVRVACVALPAGMQAGKLGRWLQARGVKMLPVDLAGRLVALPGVVLTRPADQSLAENDRSVWVRLQWPELSVWVSGDPLESGVDAWLASADAGPADVLVLPHHGRRHARLPTLLARVRPKLALVSNRSDGGPSAQAVEAQALGVRVLETGLCGNLKIDLRAAPRVSTQWPVRL